MHQVHGPRVIDADNTASLVQADAAVSRRPGTVCVVKIADCLPVLFAGEGVVAAAHAGWRGLAAGVLEASVDAMRVDVTARRVAGAVVVEPQSRDAAIRQRDGPMPERSVCAQLLVA